MLRREGREVSKEAASLGPSPPLNGFCTSSRDRFTWLCCIRLPLSRGLQYSLCNFPTTRRTRDCSGGNWFLCVFWVSCLRRGQTFLKINTDGFLPSGFTLPTSLVDSESTFCRRLLLLFEFPSSSFDGCREGIIETKADRLRAEAACDE